MCFIGVYPGRIIDVQRQKQKFGQRIKKINPFGSTYPFVSAQRKVGVKWDRNKEYRIIFFQDSIYVAT